MKRHEAIAPLSRDHHETLILAQLLKLHAPVYKGLPSQPGDRARYAIHQFDKHIQKHFRQEEFMLSKVQRIHPEVKALVKAIKTEHRELTGLFKALEGAPEVERLMNELAVKLEDHIRKEERQLFPLIQQHAGEELLAVIYELLH